jgi:DNA-directed RNA polymerase subunit RPC12/RpoP
MKRIGNPTDLFSDRPNGSDAYKEFDATELYCPRCKQPVPVRKRLLLVLPEGDKYEYLCAYCSETVGTKMDKKDKPLSIIT